MRMTHDSAQGGICSIAAGEYSRYSRRTDVGIACRVFSERVAGYFDATYV